MSLPEINLGSPSAPSWRQRLDAYVRLVRLHKPIGIFLLMWPSLWALWLAGAGHPPWGVVLIFIAGVVLADSEYRHELESDIEPFKGLLLGIFFISIGASLNFSLIVGQ